MVFVYYFLNGEYNLSFSLIQSITCILYIYRNFVFFPFLACELFFILPKEKAINSLRCYNIHVLHDYCKKGLTACLPVLSVDDLLIWNFFFINIKCEFILKSNVDMTFISIRFFSRCFLSTGFMLTTMVFYAYYAAAVTIHIQSKTDFRLFTLR